MLGIGCAALGTRSLVIPPANPHIYHIAGIAFVSAGG